MSPAIPDVITYAVVKTPGRGNILVLPAAFQLREPLIDARCLEPGRRDEVFRLFGEKIADAFQLVCGQPGGPRPAVELRSDWPAAPADATMHWRPPYIGQVCVEFLNSPDGFDPAAVIRSENPGEPVANLRFLPGHIAMIVVDRFRELLADAFTAALGERPQILFDSEISEAAESDNEVAVWHAHDNGTDPGIRVMG